MKIALLTNILTPYRIAFYKELYMAAKKQKIDFKILVMSETEKNRNWKFEEYATEFTQLLDKKVIFNKPDVLFFNTDLKQTLNNYNPDILILSGSYTFFPVWQALKWAKKRKCLKVFWSESHLDEVRNYNRLKYGIREIVRKAFYHQMDAFWAPGKKASDFIRRYAGEEKKIIHVPNLIDNQKFEALIKNIKSSKDELKKKYHLSQDKIIFFGGMRLTNVKGLMPFMEQFINSKCKDKVQFVVAGEGELKEELFNYAKEHHIDLQLLGYRNEEEMVELLFLSDVFFLPSLSDPNPLSCIEAVWCGKPLLVSEHVGNYPELVQDGKNGYVFSYEKTDDLKQKIEYLVNKDENWFLNAGEVSREIAQVGFENEVCSKRIIFELIEVITKRLHYETCI